MVMRSGSRARGRPDNDRQSGADTQPASPERQAKDHRTTTLPRKAGDARPECFRSPHGGAPHRPAREETETLPTGTTPTGDADRDTLRINEPLSRPDASTIIAASTGPVPVPPSDYALTTRLRCNMTSHHTRSNIRFPTSSTTRQRPVCYLGSPPMPTKRFSALNAPFPTSTATNTQQRA